MTTENDQLTFEGMERTDPGEELKRQGIEKVLANTPDEWRDAVLDIIAKIARSKQKFTADDVMWLARRSAVGKPHHPNAWGGVYRMALNRKIMERTGQFLKSRRVGQRATMIPEYRSLVFSGVLDE